MDRVIIKYKSGMKMNQQEMFSLPLTKDILIGRDPSVEVVFDATKEDMVSRQHAKITQSPENPEMFSLTDLHSRNGTFVNKNRITGDVKLTPGDIIQFGTDGPEIEFDLDPRPASQPPATRLVDVSGQPPVGMTREVPVQVQTKPASTAEAVRNVGHATVERMIVKNSQENKKFVVNIAAGLAALVVIAFCGVIYYNKMHKPPIAPVITGKVSDVMSAADITRLFEESAVYIETSWKLIHIESGQELYHANYSECSKDGKKCSDFYPAYARVGDTLEPYLTTNAISVNEKGESTNNKPIGFRLSGSGFVVTNDGFIITNKHVAANWECPSYQAFDKPFPGVVRLDCDEALNCKDVKMKIDANNPSAMTALMKWVPANTKTLGGKPYKGKFVEGRSDYLQVTFPRQTNPIRASIINTSASADAAMIKISVPYTLKPVKISDNEVVQGEQAVVIGYPSVSPDTIAVTKSNEPGRYEKTARIIPEPTTSSGTIQRLIRSRSSVETNKKLEVEYYNTFGDVYQLGINTTGSGNSGGPVFNDKGEVIGIFTYGLASGGAAVSFAVPVKYASELMGNQRVIK
jgi:S1-C subfamily serine protease